MPYAPRATFDNPYGPQVTFRTEDVLPPAAFYISPEDRVTVWVLTDLPGLTIYIQLRMLMPTGEVQLIPYEFIPQSTLNWYPAYELPPWEGYLLGALCFSTNPQRGQCFVSVQVMRSAPPGLIQAGIVLMQGYINTQNVLSYPTSPLQSTFSGRGAFLTITEPNQIGTNMVLPSPVNTLWRVCSLTFQLNTDATAGNRTAAITLNDRSGLVVGFWNSTLEQSASTDVIYGFSCGGASSAVGINANIAGPTDLFIPEQGSIRTEIQGMTATDQIVNIAMLVEEWMGT